MPGEEPADGGQVDVEEPAGVDGDFVAFADQSNDSYLLFLGELGASASDSSVFGRREARRVPSRSMARSNSAKASTICIIMRPAGVVVSIAFSAELVSAPTVSKRCAGSNRAQKRLYRFSKAGVMITELLPETTRQPALWEELDRERRERAWRTMDQLNHKLGRNTIRVLSSGVDDGAWKLRADYRSLGGQRGGTNFRLSVPEVLVMSL